MIQLQTILHPTDFSDAANNSGHYAFALAEQFGASVQLLHVLDLPVAYAPAPGVVVPPKHYEEQRREAAERLAKLPAESVSSNVTVERVTREGSPFLEIVRHAKESKAELIVMGTHGRTGLSHLLIGSVAEKVVRKSPCPVLTVRPADHQFVMP